MTQFFLVKMLQFIKIQSKLKYSLKSNSGKKDRKVHVLKCTAHFRSVDFPSIKKETEKTPQWVTNTHRAQRTFCTHDTTQAPSRNNILGEMECDGNWELPYWYIVYTAIPACMLHNIPATCYDMFRYLHKIQFKLNQSNTRNKFSISDCKMKIIKVHVKEYMTTFTPVFLSFFSHKNPRPRVLI